MSVHLLAFGVDGTALANEPTTCQLPAGERFAWLVMWLASSLALYPLANLEHWYWSSQDFFRALRWGGAFELHAREAKGEAVSAAEWRACSRMVHRRWPRAVSYMIMYSEEPWGRVCKGLLLCASLLV